MPRAQLQLPRVLQEAVLALRAEFRERNIKARERFEAMLRADPSAQVPKGKLFLERPDKLGAELTFWNIADDRALEEFVFGELLSVHQTRGSLGPLPAGYAPLFTVLDFEAACQYSAWRAVARYDTEEMRAIVAAFRTLGLDDESRAIEAVAAAYALAATGEGDEFDYEGVLGAAYSSVPNRTRDIEDRLPLVFAYVRAHPQEFGEAA
jgi:hypothetical protein